MRGRLQTTAKIVGALAGAAAGVLALAAWRVPAHDVGPGASISLVAHASRGVRIEGPEVQAGDVRARGPRGALVQSLLVSSRHGGRVRLALGASAPDLDSILRVSVSVNGRPLAQGVLASLRRAELRFPLRPHATRQLDVRVWIPAGQLTGFERHRETLFLRLGAAGA